eukprot:TRINITY_DN22486_c0_g1_i1.p1 TRINITY_DN22486_c0_g1~~TRINITY_DN22486_c0_g1_i1.p1  ORF type:complete len:294 (-),score=53.98 TRINITY_DN22486_c0_g1_i1:88-969(-)
MSSLARAISVWHIKIHPGCAPEVGTNELGLRVHKIIRRLRKACVIGESGKMASIREVFRALDSKSFGWIEASRVRELLDTHDKHRDNPLKGLPADAKDSLVRIAAERRGDGKITYSDFFQALMGAAPLKYVATSATQDQTTDMLQLVLITRHGARFPLKRFPHNTSWPEHPKFWKVYGGKLTPTGQQQLWQLGHEIQQRYGGNWDQDHPGFPQQCYVYSSNSDRTIGSAQALLNGMFPTLMHTFMVADQVRHPKEWETRANERSENLSLIHISEPTRLLSISYAVFCLKKKKK